MIYVLAGQFGSPKLGPSGSGSVASANALSPDDLEKLKEAAMPQLKQSSYARLQNDYGDALSGLDSSLASVGKQSGSEAPDDTGYTEKADKQGSGAKGTNQGDGKGKHGGGVSVY